MRFRLRTLLIVLAVAPPLLAGTYFTWRLLTKVRVNHPTYNDRNAARLIELQIQAGGTNASNVNGSFHADPPTPLEILQQRLAEAERELGAQDKSAAP
jgi:hypothetical protein